MPLVDAPAEIATGRVDHLVIHFTSLDFAESMRLLTERTETPVSVHYLVPESGDPTYPRRRLRVYRLVDEGSSAWHAGDSAWRGVTSLNARSIGIEIVNRSRCIEIDSDLEPKTPENERCAFEEYDPEQIALAVALARDILERHPGIDPEDVVGHADIAPGRRADPGPTFPWRELHEQGIGAWFDDETVAAYRVLFEADPPTVSLLQRALAAYGYEVDETGADDAETRFALRAFQMHFRPDDWSGRPDAETAAILFALIDKYRPRALAELVRLMPQGSL
ncbi:MAG TPA: N-acetylmuramoyl-L-alanine amidase [Gammaproteobacteria bacterium]|nr:N-acetylmuramoyl-L-alanine amidase [Gammaproteobacteria bacterium]